MFTKQSIPNRYRGADGRWVDVGEGHVLIVPEVHRRHVDIVVSRAHGFFHVLGIGSLIVGIAGAVGVIARAGTVAGAGVAGVGVICVVGVL